jgi:hypothetical protein
MWRLLTSLSPERIVQCIDFHHLRDVLTEDELLGMLQAREAGKAANLERLSRDGVRVYSTAGWSGRPLEEVRQLCGSLYAQGTRAFKAKVGRGQQYDRARALDEDRRMLDTMRAATGSDALLLTDANQNLGDWRNAASYDAAKGTLTILRFNYQGDTAYVNSMWENQRFPYRGDVVNAYNDGPNDTGGQLGAFYELETSSPALVLPKRAAYRHVQQTFHFEGTAEELNAICKKVLGVELNQVPKL